MIKIKWLLTIFLVTLLLASLMLAACSKPSPTTPAAPQAKPTTPASPAATTAPPAKPASPAPSPAATSAPAKTLYIGGTFALTGAYAEDCAAILAGFQDYTKWLNENKILAPWYKDKKIPANVTFEVLWRDDELMPEKALSIYDELKGKGLLVERVSGSPQALALIQRLDEDRIGATSQAAGPYLLTPPRTIFTNYPIYTDGLAAVADWFKSNWKETRKPRVAYLTADNSMGKSMDIPEMQAYLEKIGFEFAGRQFVPLVPTSPPTTQLAWLKENKVDLALGVMVNPGSQPTIKEAVRLDMGPSRGYKITFAFGVPSHLQVFLPAMGPDLAEGVVLGGGYAAWEETVPGITFAKDLQNKYRPDKKVSHIMYVDGIVEAMTQVEAMRLAMEKVSADKLKSVDVLESGFFMIKNLDTGGITSTPMTFGKGDVEGVDQVRIQQIMVGKIVQVGLFPLRHVYTIPK